MKTKQLEIASAASVLAGGDKIEAWDEDTIEAEAVRAVYADVYENALAHKAWTFAREIIEPQLIQKEPKSGYKYAYKIPAEVVKVLNLRHPVEYTIIKRRELHTNEMNPRVECTVKVQEEELPGDFVLALKHLLASKVSIPIAENATRANALEGLGTKYIMQAADNDLAQEPGSYVEEWDLFDSHFGG